jgi:photosystem II stability/assembly factor-like uncharacterized protein
MRALKQLFDSSLFIFVGLAWPSDIVAAQWVWQNPKPTGNDLTSVCFVSPDVGWIAGINGTLLKTTNGGYKWCSLPGPLEYNYTVLCALNKDTLWAATCGYTGSQFFQPFKLLFSSNGGNSWEVKADQETLANGTISSTSYIRDLSFADVRNGFGVGDSGLVLRTTDGGSQWVPLQRPTLDCIRAVQFFDPLNGYIAGGDFYSALCDYPPLCPSYSHGTIMKTTDGGNTWQMLYRDTLAIHDIFFLSPSIGWASGSQLWDEGYTPREADYMLKTTNGGQTWSYTQLTGSIFWQRMASICFANDTDGWAVGQGGAVERTTDGGNSWTLSYPPVQRVDFRFLNNVFFVDSLNGFAVGTDGVILQTSDGGSAWNEYSSVLNIGYNNSDVHFINPDTGWIVSDWTLYQTTDKGESWENENVHGWHIDCVAGGNCWVVGAGGTIMYTSDAGNTWSTQTSGTNAGLWDVRFLDANIGWAVGEQTILKTENGGRLWTTQYVSSAPAPYDHIVIQDSLRVWVYGAQGSCQTKDGGKTWSTIEGIRPVFFLNSDTGWASGQRTFDGGKTWESIGLALTINCKFVDANRGWDKFLHVVNGTRDGGVSMQRELSVDVYHSLYGEMHFTDSAHGWAVGGGGTLLRYGYPEITTSVAQDGGSFRQPEEFQLYQNFPNPFNPRTRIRFSIRKRAFTSLRVYNILGMEIVTLVNQDKPPGTYQIDWDAKHLPSGIYFCRLVAGRVAQTKKMLIIR